MARLVPPPVAEDRGYRSPCLIFQGHKGDKGYGYMGNEQRKIVRAHRLYYEREHGPIPPGLEIDHKCRVRDCVNHEHMELVTHAEHMRRSSNATPLPVQLAIRKAYATGRTTITALAAEHHIGKSSVHRIIHRKESYYG